MTPIATFTRREDGSFQGAIRTLTLNAKAVTIQPVERTSAKAPDFRVTAAGVEIGAAWRLERPGKPDTLSVRLDDPVFPAPVHGRLAETPEGYALLWSRRAAAAR